MCPFPVGRAFLLSLWAIASGIPALCLPIEHVVLWQGTVNKDGTHPSSIYILPLVINLLNLQE